MKSFKISEITNIKMLSNPPDEIINCGMYVICNGGVYQFEGNYWLYKRPSEREDYKEIPEAF